MKRKLLILAAMEMESRAIAEASGNTSDLMLDIRAVGIACSRLDRSMFQPPTPAPHPALWPEHRGEGDTPATVIVAGLAGALDPRLQIGDVVIDAQGLVVPAGVSARPGRIHTAKRIICSAQEKAGLFSRTGAIAVDMELEIVRDLTAKFGMPCIGVRAISDRADESIDPAVLRFVDDRGRPRIGAILWNLLRRPRLIAQAWRLARNGRIACRRLGEAVRELITHPEFIRRFGSSADCREGCEPRA